MKTFFYNSTVHNFSTPFVFKFLLLLQPNIRNYIHTQKSKQTDILLEVLPSLYT